MFPGNFVFPELEIPALYPQLSVHINPDSQFLRKLPDVQGVPKKTLFYVFANFSANTYSRETSRISTELAWQEASNDK